MMKSTWRLAGVVLIASCHLAFAQNTPPTAPHASSSPSATEPAANSSLWVNVSAAFTKEIGTDENKTGYLRNCQGLIVTPTGNLVMLTANQGICISKDQGATWSVVADNDITGRCEFGWAFVTAYPYDGRLAFMAYDGGRWGTAGGMSLDGGKTWMPFTRVQRGTEYGDIFWNGRDSTVYAVTHEPYYSLLSDDAGRSWHRLDQNENGSKKTLSSTCVGIVDARTLVRYDANQDGGIIERSADAGQTWTKVTADYKVTGRSVVHYGPKIYWITTKGVITSTDGKSWTLTGPGAEGASYGPYFGSSDQEFVVVTDKSFLKTEDGGKTWRQIAKLFKAPDIYHNFAGYSYFGWDSQHNILYTSGLGASVYKLQLDPNKAADSAEPK